MWMPLGGFRGLCVLGHSVDRPNLENEHLLRIVSSAVLTTAFFVCLLVYMPTSTHRNLSFRIAAQLDYLLSVYARLLIDLGTLQSSVGP